MSLIGWRLPCGATVEREVAAGISDTLRVWFDRRPVNERGGSENTGAWAFRFNGMACGLFPALTPPPSKKVDWTKPCELVSDGTPVLILTTSALGPQPVIFQVTGQSELQRDNIWGTLVRNVPEEVVIMVKLTVSADYQTIQSIEVVK